MTDEQLIDKLTTLVGQSITGITYTPTKFHYSTPTSSKGNWIDVNPDLFVLHSPEWQFHLSGGQTVYLRSELLSNDNFSSKIIIIDKTNTSQEDTILEKPRRFKWTDILDKPIKKFRLWQRVISSSKVLGREFNLKYQDHYQIIELLCGDKTLLITTMDGDIGHMTFYPTGCTGERLGLVISKTICTSHTVYDLTMRMAITYKFG